MDATKNVEAFRALRAIGFPSANIRRALPALVGRKVTEVASATELSRAAVSNALNGLRPGREETRRRVADYFGMDPDEMFPVPPVF